MAASTPIFAGRARRGMTLIEVLVAAAISMIVLLAVIQIFQVTGTAVNEGRAAIELAGQIRRVGEQFRQDIRGLTVPTKPWPTDAAAEGYFEYIEGPMWDGQNLSDGNPANDVPGDVDDVIMFTARSRGKPFIGQLDGVTRESDLAEIVMWTSNGNVHRRVLLIRPDLNVDRPVTTFDELASFFATNDVSARPNGATGLVANTLADLTKRENRYAHVRDIPIDYRPIAAGGHFPFPLNVPFLTRSDLARREDILLTHVVAFDVKVFDPTAVIRNSGGRALVPSDPGYVAAVAAGDPVIGQGAYVDLGYTAATSRFSGPPHAKSQLAGALAPALPQATTFCTWSSHYERDGIDQGNWTTAGMLVDEGTDGLDNDGQNGVDDGGEQETSPPYPYALRSLQVTFRAIDLDNQKVRQTTVTHDFLRE